MLPVETARIQYVNARIVAYDLLNVLKNYNIMTGAKFFADTLASNNNNVLQTIGNYNGWPWGMTYVCTTPSFPVQRINDFALELSYRRRNWSMLPLPEQPGLVCWSHFCSVGTTDIRFPLAFTKPSTAGYRTSTRTLTTHASASFLISTTAATERCRRLPSIAFIILLSSGILGTTCSLLCNIPIAFACISVITLPSVLPY